MKSKLFGIFAVSLLSFTACSSDSDDTNLTPQPEELTTLVGSINTSQSLKAGTVTLEGATIVREGAVLTIPAGTTIVAKDKGSYLLVERGAKIIAVGTSEKPITFTSNDKTSGAWGGLIINGRAPLSRANITDPSTFGTEINDQIQYGGDDVADNSGVLDYVILEYTGSNISDDKEHNGLTLNGVGNGTKISNIFILSSADDAIEFFGGSVDVTNLLAVDSEDDMFDFTQGYTGTLTNAYGIWTANFSTNEADPRGVEADGNHDGNGSNHINQSNFKMQDITIVQNSKTPGVAGTMQDVIKVRRGATASTTNLLVKVGENSLVGDMIDFTDGKGVGSATISYTLLPAELTAKINPADASGIIRNTTSTGANTSVFAWTKFSF
ncbi:hypothetical protein [Sphingobacterium rhinopitheci]|uniref:hypothetical protein n=1 Tax=Sphingobacterium rhinopitheci TaxID=2781960 RepID=UPI001F5293F2|nr:hypothetical protein [Sphingobacterium rhinopitheci]MCI0920223.1 hypothetical protein [Sphingobacterium rhinopitheci]